QIGRGHPGDRRDARSSVRRSVRTSVASSSPTLYTLRTRFSPSSRNTLRTWRKQIAEMVLPASVWVEVEAAAVEVDRRLEVLPVAEAAGGVPDPLDRRVQPFGRRVGDPVAQVGEDVRQVRLEHPRLLDHGLDRKSVV